MNTTTLQNALHNKTPDERALVEHALAFATAAHKNQKRLSGEPYIVHPITVAHTLALLGMDAKTISAGLLHDVLEDNHGVRDRLKKEFDSEIFFLVEGVTKLGTLKYKGLERHAESLRKLFVAMAKDIRTLIIRLADRLHNVETLEFVPEEKRVRIANETLEIYAPLANRLGMGVLKEKLEDAAFPHAYPKEHAQVRELLKSKHKETEERLEKMYRSLATVLAQNRDQQFSIDYRVKGLYSLYRKLLRYNMDIEKVYDIIALRVIVPSVSDCYNTLGLVHSLWKPAPERIKDYIATPKPNGYQSIHTSVFAGDGAVAEIQIRTETMHAEAEHGVASHIGYKESGKPRAGGKIAKQLGWVHELLRYQREFKTNEEFLENLKMDFFQNRIFVFTPKGDVIELPEGASVLDFAYHIHSDVGNHASAATVSGKYVGLDHTLHSGDIVHVETKKTNRPSKKWMEYVHTSLARKHIKMALQEKFKGKSS